MSELLPMAVWTVDSEGRVVTWALAAEDLLGFRPEEVVGRRMLRQLVPKSNWELADELVARVRGGETVTGAYPLRHRAGRLVEMEMWMCPVPDPAGRPGLLVIAAQTSAVRRMRDSLAAMEGLFSQSPIGLALFDPRLRYVRVNEALARINGLPAAAHIGARVAEVVPKVDTATLEAVMRQVLDTGRAVVDIRTGRTAAAPGHDRVWSCSYAPLADSGGQQLGLIASVVDITQGEQDHLRAERARQRFALLAEAGERIGTTLDMREAAGELAQMLVPQLADTADVFFLEGTLAPDDVSVTAHGLLHRLAVATTDPDAPVHELLLDLTYQVPPQSAYAHIIADGRPETLPMPLPPLTPALTEQARRYFHARLGSARVIPLVARGSVLGLVVATRTRNEPFDDQDTVLIDELVARAALNIDNARLYTNQREAALTLQRSLLSPLPEIPGLELAGCYLPASSENEVGGDWFDAIPLPGGRTGLVIGDVRGHGIRAAAVMGQLRTVVRTLACQGAAPAALLRHLDRAVADLGEGELATCAYVVYDPATADCLIARAGHPPPALVRPHCAVEFLDGPCGTPLGLASEHPFEAERVPLPPGSLLALYTDGLIEHRGRDLDEGLDDLARALRQPHRTLQETGDQVIARVAPTPPRDDVALLLARPQARPGSPPGSHRAG